MIVWTLLGSLATLYVAVAVFAFVGQRRLIYPVPLHAEVPRARSGQLVDFRADDGQRVLAYYSRAHPGQATVVLFHGNGEQLADQADLIDELAAVGLGAFAVEYPGYGLLSAHAPNETDVFRAASEALTHLRQALAVPNAHIVLWGRSLGTGVAVEMAKRGFGQRMVLISPYTSMTDLGRRIAPFLPVSLLIRDRYDSMAKASTIEQATLIVHGANDQVIPFDMGKQLHESIRNSQLEIVNDADHNDLLAVGGSALWERILRFARGAE